MSSKTSASSDTVPLSLGKPSLRRRLEAYYKQVSPEQVENEEEWKDRFEKIWEKFGGSFNGEQKLASKLEKKYGSMVRLQIMVNPKASLPQAQIAKPAENIQNEDYFVLTELQRQSGVVSFTDANFDPLTALCSSRDKVLAANPWVEECSLLERVDQCQSILPPTDPLFKPAMKKAVRRPTEPTVKVKATPTFAAIASLHKEGPLFVLYDAVIRRKRIRVLVRYLDGIRGTLTGHVLAFDKHFNLLLKDVHEVYSPRLGCQEGTSRTEMEIERRLRGYTGGNRGENWSCRQRRMGQIMVRGDMIVLVYKPDQEQSCWPVTNKSPKDTIYRKKSARKDVPSNQRVGTPGSLSLAAQRQGG